MFLNSIWPIEPSQKKCTGIFWQKLLCYYRRLPCRLSTDWSRLSRSDGVPARSILAGTAERSKRTGISLTSSHWLETAAPATSMTQSRKTSQFTLVLQLPLLTQRRLDPPVVSLSSDPYIVISLLGRRELTWSFGSTLWLEKTGQTPSWLSLIFADTNFHHLVITYSASVFRLYRRITEFTFFQTRSRVALFQYLLPSSFEYL